MPKTKWCTIIHRTQIEFWVFDKIITSFIINKLILSKWFPCKASWQQITYICFLSFIYWLILHVLRTEQWTIQMPASRRPQSRRKENKSNKLQFTLQYWNKWNQILSESKAFISPDCSQIQKVSNLRYTFKSEHTQYLFIETEFTIIIF